MYITIAVGGRFHAFNLAAQLEKKGLLKSLITSYPRFATEKYGITREHIHSVIAKELIQRSWELLPRHLQKRLSIQFFLNELFDTQVLRHISRPLDIFVGFSSFSLHSMRAAKKLGAITVVECGSSHLNYSAELLKEEYERFGLTVDRTHPKTKEKILSEYRDADYISIPSRFVKRTFIEQGIPEEKLIHTPYGVDLSEFRKIPKRDTIFRVVFAGGICIRKGAHYLLQAFSELDLPNAELWLIGKANDEMQPFFQEYNGNFKLIGCVPQKQLYEFYSQGSVFILNSIEDGFGMVIAQAMACGLPMIATENTGARDIIRDGVDGFIIPIRDVEALKEKISYLHQNPDICEQMGRSARERVASGFTWDDYGNRMITQYERILATKHC